MTIAEQKKISLIDYLGSLGYKPEHTRKSGNEIWYLSPLRKEKTASFKVTITANTWYDFGLSKGGSIIDFVSHYYNLSIADSLKLLNSKEINPTPYSLGDIPAFNRSGSAELRSIKELKNPHLVSYLEERHINIRIASKYVKEIYYKRNEKNLYTVGMKNDSGGYEVRTKVFKGCILSKDITSILGNFDTVSIFEGFIDFLSMLTIQNIDALKSDLIILHSTSMIKKAIHKISSREYRKVYAFLDNDEAGNIALSELEKINGSAIKDMRFLYPEHNDINDKLRLTNSDFHKTERSS